MQQTDRSVREMGRAKRRWRKRAKGEGGNGGGGERIPSWMTLEFSGNCNCTRFHGSATSILLLLFLRPSSSFFLPPFSPLSLHFPPRFHRPLSLRFRAFAVPKEFTLDSAVGRSLFFENTLPLCTRSCNLH